MTRVLVSVRNVEEAGIASRAGADFIDLKEPAAGALGGLPVPTISAIVAALRAEPGAPPVSATIGDLPAASLDAIGARVVAVGRCGVDYVKVGIERDPAAGRVLSWLAGCGWPVVPVFIADRGLDDALVAQALALGFPGIMADTADKRVGSLFDALPPAALRRFVAQARAAGVMVGLAGALRCAHAGELAALAPDFAGFRGAVCVGERSGALDAQRLVELLVAMRRAQPPMVGAPPSSSERTRSSSAR
jgi:(5-formylfuran-3-yl)methyl phosphate synthase